MANHRVAVSAATAAMLIAAACSSNATPVPGSSVSGSGSVATVGAILSLSGSFSTLGPPEQKAMEMGVEALNQAGFTVGGKKFTLKVNYADDKSDAPTTGATEFRQMTQADHLPLVAIGLGSSSYAPLLKRAPIPVINILDSTYPSILAYDPHLFLLRSDSAHYVAGCLDYAKTKLHASTISVISPKGEPYGEGLTQLVQQAAPVEGMTVKTVAQYPLGATDYSTQITQVLAGHPDAVYLSSVTAVQLPVLKQLRQAGYTGPVFHSSGVNPNQAQAILGAEYNSIMKDNYDCAGTLPTTSSLQGAQQFASAYHTRWNEYPQDLTMWAYDFPFVVAAAMSQAGSTTDSDKIYAALQQISVPTGTVSGWISGAGGALFTDRDAQTASEITTWCPDQKSIASAMLYQIKDGQVIDAQIRDNPCASLK